MGVFDSKIGAKVDLVVMFDFDGVLVDSEVHWRQVESGFLQKMIPSWSAADQEGIYGLGIYQVYHVLQQRYGLRVSREEFLQNYRSLSEEIYGKRCNLLPGIKPLIFELKSQVASLAVVTSSPRSWVQLAVERFQLDSAFSLLVSAEDVGAKGKPDPAVYLFALQQMNVAASRCVAIEDSARGVESAKGAGIQCIGLRNGFNDAQDLSRADIIYCLGELTTQALLQCVT